ncbi:hypothetical protein LCGC14_0289020 [marine sediment metagenome]|uniref:Uncharacterized protein n=1 Tax=marine sediment metagenome TaxID=412755 RepID=A0A0F9TTS4_9ZZZZ
MPYIDLQTRERLDGRLPPIRPGELNYSLTRVVLAYLAMQGLCYQTINDINGALMGALTEFNRRVTAPYEDRKILDNGDVYPEEVTQ